MRAEKLDWDPHYDEVRQLYLTERRDLKEIMTIFKEQYGLNATALISPRQWTSRLETWGLRKNLDTKQWKSVYCQVMKRKQQGKESEVFLSGERLPPTKIRKGFKNHHLGLPRLHSTPRSLSPPLPDETILVVTPPSQLAIQWPRNLPWFQFEGKLKQYFDLLSRERRRALWSKVLDSPNLPLLPKLLRKREKRGLSLVTSYGASQMRGFLIQYMPEAIPGEHVERAELITCRHQSFISPLAILQVFLFLVSNSLPGSSVFNRREEDQLEEDNRVMAAFEILSLFKCPWEELFAFKNPTVAALADKLFASTIRLCRADILQRLVKVGLNILPLVNRPISFYLEATSLGRFYYKVPPIYAALYMRSSWMVWILLDHGAELNHVAHQDEDEYEYEYPSPIACAALSHLGEGNGKDSMYRMIRLVLGRQRHIDEVQLICGLVALATRPLQEDRTSGAKLILDRLMKVEVSTGLRIPGVVLALAIRFDYEPLIRRLVFSSKGIKYDAGFDNGSLPWGSKIIIFTPLVEATCRRNYMLCQTLLKRGAQPNPPAERDSELALSALQYATFLGEIGIVRLLLAYGADTAHQSDVSEMFPIRYFSYSESRLLPRATALCLAIYQNQIEIFQALLDAGAKPTECDMYAAIMSKNPVFFMGQMLERGATPDEQTFIYAKSRGDKQLVNLLVGHWAEGHMLSHYPPISHSIPSHSTRYNPVLLVEAAYKAAHGETSLLGLLLDKRQLEDNSSVIPVRQCLEGLAPVISVFFGDSATCSILARHGLLQQKIDFGLFVRIFHEGLNIEHLNISIHYLPSLSTFPTDYDIEIQYFAVDLEPVSVRFESRDFSLLGIAIETGREATVDLLLGIGIKPTVEDFRISRKHHWAWRRLLESIGTLNNMEAGDAILVNAALDSDLLAAVEWFIESNIDFNDPRLIVDGRHTILQAVCDWGDLRLVRLLVDRGADINAPAVDWGATALQLAAIRGFIGIARFLIAEGADCNAPAARERGRTALEGAAEHGRLDMLEFLLHSGVRTDGPFRRQYFRAIKFAEVETYYAAAQLLRDHREWSNEDHDGFRDTCLCEYRSHYRRCHYYTKLDDRKDENHIDEERFEAHDMREKEGVPYEALEFVNGQTPLADATVGMLQPFHETIIPNSPGLLTLATSGTDENLSASYGAPCSQVDIDMIDKAKYAEGDGVLGRGCQEKMDCDHANTNRLLSPSIFEVENSLGHEDWVEEFVGWDGQVFGLFDGQRGETMETVTRSKQPRGTRRSGGNTIHSGQGPSVPWHNPRQAQYYDYASVPTPYGMTSPMDEDYNDTWSQPVDARENAEPFSRANKRRRIVQNGGSAQERGVMRDGNEPGVPRFIGSSSGIHLIRTVSEVLARSHTDQSGSGQEVATDLVPGEEDQLTAPSASDPLTPDGPSITPFWHPDEITGSTGAVDFDDMLQWTESYFKYWHPIFPLLHGPGFLGLLEQASENGIEALNQADAILEDIASSLNFVLGTPASIQNIQAALCVELFLISMLKFNMASRVGGTIVRMAFNLGLHRCPGRFINFDTHHAMMRKRLWWSIYCLDRVVCQTLGLPLGIRDDDVDVCLPMEELHGLEGDRKGQGSENEQLQLLTMLSKHAKLRGMILELRNKSIRFRHEDSERVLRVQAEVKRWINEIYDLTSSPSPRQSSIESVRNEYSSRSAASIPSSHSMLLSILQHELILSLHRPLLASGLGTLSSQAAFQECINASRFIIDITADISQENQNGGPRVRSGYLLWPSLTWSVWMSCYVLTYAAIEGVTTAVSARRYADRALQVLKLLSLRKTSWPEKCILAVERLTGFLDARIYDERNLPRRRKSPSNPAKSRYFNETSRNLAGPHDPEGSRNLNSNTSPQVSSRRARIHPRSPTPQRSASRRLQSTHSSTRTTNALDLSLTENPGIGSNATFEYPDVPDSTGTNHTYIDPLIALDFANFTQGSTTQNITDLNFGVHSFY
ncbi:hypothetical protein O1611_g2468 [Lasiodiplodia mahajangana]|uniref:Uncharacterized protein n=1 Tax=Lasiodiplodia mahajangana TaxID=1108764 RepID=A0ACC2JUT5_9PEZI|nr:hypothetical protein O1611_g2468 [Lasiodiplodia mahajangana]